jgi:hypothetical protein
MIKWLCDNGPVYAWGYDYIHPPSKIRKF